MFRFATPEYFYLLILVPVLIGVYWYSVRVRRRALERFGDPETEVVLPKLTSDLGAGISAILDGETPEFTWDESNATLGVVIASNGYPENVIKGARVPEIEVDEDSHVYYAGVASDEHGNLVANSGRVLLVETSAPDIKSAQDKVYAIIDKLELRGLFYRHDIGFKALK